MIALVPATCMRPSPMPPTARSETRSTPRGASRASGTTSKQRKEDAVETATPTSSVSRLPEPRITVGLSTVASSMPSVWNPTKRPIHV
eukprot:1874862-Prymnesium_polylepis.1